MFGDWVVLTYVGAIGKIGLWSCRCVCGAVKVVRGNNLRSGRSASCGCMKRTRNGETQKHRIEFRAWMKMHDRCYNPDHRVFHHYGGRGIKVCERWHEPGGLARFLADMGERPPKMTLERKDVNGDYSPTNCVWATWKEQSRNTRRNRNYTFCGETKCLMDWSIALGINYDTLRSRLGRGLSVEEAFTQ